MNKLNLRGRLPQQYDRQVMDQIIGALQDQLNALAEGRLPAAFSAFTSAPTWGTWGIGDIIRNSSPSELGTAGNKYIIWGFECITAGSPGTWRELRALTGN